MVLLCLGGWIGWHAVAGARALRTAAAQVQSISAAVRSGQDAIPAAERAAERTSYARRSLDDPLVRLVAKVPLLGRPVRTATAVSVASDSAVRGALLPLVRAAGRHPLDNLIGEGGAINASYLADLSGPVASSSVALRSAAFELQTAPRSSGISAIDDARRSLATNVTRLSGIVDQVLVVSQAGPTLLGVDRPRRYLVIAQNPAEARGTGGLVGGYVELEADNGLLRMVRSGSNQDLTAFMQGVPVADLGPEFQGHYGFYKPNVAWVNANFSPHFPYAGTIWSALWQRQTHEKLDGVVAVDPVALSYVMAATGPVTLSDGTTVTSGNVVDVTLRDVYARFPANQVERKSYLQEISRSVAGSLTTGGGNRKELLKGLTRAASERRLVMWTSDPDLRAALGASAVTGRLPQGTAAVGDVINDVTGSKLDYYLDRTLSYVPGCNGTRSSLSLTLNNTAPTSGLPSYVTSPQFRVGLPAGTSRMLVNLYLPPQSRVAGVLVGGKPALAQQGEELGLHWVQTLVTLGPGKQAVLRVDFDERLGARSSVERVQQPLVRPEQFTVTAC